MASATAFPELCQGDLWQARGYFVSGASLYYCEYHAKQSMRGNPFGARFKPQTTIQKRKNTLKELFAARTVNKAEGVNPHEKPAS